VHGEDGTVGAAIPLGFVVVQGDVYIRAYRGERSAWLRAARLSGSGRVTLECEQCEVAIEPASAAVTEAVGTAYRSKYPAEAIGLVNNPTARAAPQADRGFVSIVTLRAAISAFRWRR
jgi:hypothetical protein